MKKLFSNPLFLHGFYGCLVILLLGYIYLTNVPIKEYETIANTMDNNNKIINTTSEETMNNLASEILLYRNQATIQNQENAFDIIENKTKVTTEIDSLIYEFNRNLEHYPSIIKHSSIPSRLFFSNKIINHYQYEIENFYNSTLLKISDERFSQIMRTYFKPTSFAKAIDSLQYLPANIVILNLKKQKSYLNSMELSVLNFYLQKTGFGSVKFDKFMVGLIPNKTQIKEGESFSMDIAAMNYSSLYCNELRATFFVNNQPIPYHDGIGHFETIYKKAGKQSINAKIITKNEFTGEVKSYSKDYTFEVLPK